MRCYLVVDGEPGMCGSVLSLKEMCARFAVTPRTVRYYEYIELIAPRREGRKRVYGPREIARMTLIRRGRRLGFSLEEIRQWLELYDLEGPRAQLEAAREMIERQMQELQSRRVELDETISELEALRDSVAHAIGGSGDGQHGK